MRAVRGKDTAPEMTVRRAAHGMGYRFRLHSRNLPGTPDLAFASRRKVIFVHGCFWHGHDCRKGALPKSNAAFWTEKRAQNIARDAEALGSLAEAGWKALVIWECETRNRDELLSRLRTFLT
jgi:DNA mismatch endonuclease, patch repair protein